MPEINGVIIDGVEYTFPGGGSGSDANSLPYDIISNNFTWDVPNSTRTLLINVDNLGSSDFPLKLFDSQILFYNKKYYMAYLYDTDNSTTTKDYNSKNLLLADITAGEDIRQVNLADLVSYLKILMKFVFINDVFDPDTGEPTGEHIIYSSWGDQSVIYKGQLVVYDFSLLEKIGDNFDHSVEDTFNILNYDKVIEQSGNIGRITVDFNYICEPLPSNIISTLDKNKNYETEEVVRYDTSDGGYNYLRVWNSGSNFFSERATLDVIMQYIAKLQTKDRLPISLLDSNIIFDNGDSSDGPFYNKLIIDLNKCDRYTFPSRLWDGQVIYKDEKFYMIDLFDTESEFLWRSYDSYVEFINDIDSITYEINLTDLISYIQTLLGYAGTQDYSSSREIHIVNTWSGYKPIYPGEVVLYMFTLAIRTAANLNNENESNFTKSNYIRLPDFRGIGLDNSEKYYTSYDFCSLFGKNLGGDPPNVSGGKPAIVEDYDITKSYDAGDVVRVNVGSDSGLPPVANAYSYLKFKTAHTANGQTDVERADLQDIITYIAKKSV